MLDTHIGGPLTSLPCARPSPVPSSVLQGQQGGGWCSAQGKGAAREKYWESEASEELKGWGKLKSRNIFLCPFLPAECQSQIFLCPSLPAECQSWRPLSDWEPHFYKR